MPRGSVPEISMKREICSYCTMPGLSAGSFPHLQTEFQGLHWQDQGLRTRGFLPDTVGQGREVGLTNERTTACKAKGRLCL